MKFLDDLNDNQRQAVEFVEGASLVIAGAGSGKTRVLTYKIAYLLKRGLTPSSILALTFTNKAAREMKERISALVGENTARHLWMGTFHSIFSRILRNEADKLGYTKNFTIYDSSDSKSLIKSIIKELKLDDKVYKHGLIHSRISYAKNNLITPEAYRANGDLLKSDMNSKVPRAGEVYQIYVERCKQADAMDFDDLLLQTNVLFRDFPQVLHLYKERFSYILVDEYQDTNYAQYLIVKKLSEGHERICVVGDDAQSIYSFRGANIENILQFQNNYKSAKIFKLEQNYRSTQTIVNAANSLIGKNKAQIPKTVFSEKDKGHLIKVLQVYSDHEEGQVVAGQIADFKFKGEYHYQDIALLYRTNSQSRVLEDQLRKNHIPYRIYGGLSFYQRKEIKDLISYFRLITNHSDEEALKRIINYPARGIGDTTVNKVLDCAHTQGVAAWDVMTDPLRYNLGVNAGTATKLASFCSMIRVFSEQVSTVDAYQLAQSVVKTTGIISDAYIDRSPENLSKQENVQELLKAIHEFSDSKMVEGQPADLSDFLSEVSLLTDQDTNEDLNEDKITLMTVHAAKGLEFKVVFIVGMEEELFPSMFSVESARELEEERRLFYVALTRAEERCFISYAKSRFRNGKVNFSNPSRFIKDIDQQFLDQPQESLKPKSSFWDEPYDFEQERGFFQSNKPVDKPSYAERNGYGERKQVYPPKEIPIVQREKPKNLVKLNASSKSAPASGSTNADLPVGQKVKHAVFGEGTVLAVSMLGGNEKAEIDFGAKGVKSLLLKFAKLDKI